MCDLQECKTMLPGLILSYSSLIGLNLSFFSYFCKKLEMQSCVVEDCKTGKISLTFLSFLFFLHFLLLVKNIWLFFHLLLYFMSLWPIYRTKIRCKLYSRYNLVRYLPMCMWIKGGIMNANYFQHWKFDLQPFFQKLYE